MYQHVSSALHEQLIVKLDVSYQTLLVKRIAQVVILSINSVTFLRTCAYGTFCPALCGAFFIGTREESFEVFFYSHGLLTVRPATCATAHAANTTEANSDGRHLYENRWHPR